MNQRTHNNVSLLDLAKAAIEQLVTRLMPLRIERFLLVTCDDNPVAAVKAGWSESYSTFVQEMKNLKATDLGNLGASLRNAFKLANLFRLQTGIDSYCMGRCPWQIDPIIVILLTDGSCDITEQELLDAPPPGGAGLTEEPFRWDQRLFSVLLRFPGGTSQDTSVPHDDTLYQKVHQNLTKICELAGGKCYTPHNMKSLIGALDNITNIIQYTGVLVSFESLSSSPTPPPPPSALHKMLFVQQGTPGFWPIPESFFVDSKMSIIPRRPAHPVIHFAPSESGQSNFPNIPYDKYEIEASELTQYLLNHRSMCWQVFVKNSGKSSTTKEPFGFIQASNDNKVFLVVTAYYYTKFEELMTAYKMGIPMQWRHQFETYLQSVPSYYIPFLKTAIKRLGLPPVIPDHVDGALNPNVTKCLKIMKTTAEEEMVNFRKQKEIINSQRSFEMGSSDSTQSFHNAFYISRQSLLSSIEHLQDKLFGKPSVRDVSKHRVSIEQMGNYQEVLQHREVLRPIDDEAERRNRKPFFGNPYRVSSKQIVDEADVDQSNTNASFPRKMAGKKRYKPPTRTLSLSPVSKIPKVPSSLQPKLNPKQQTNTPELIPMQEQVPPRIAQQLPPLLQPQQITTTENTAPKPPEPLSPKPKTLNPHSTILKELRRPSKKYDLLFEVLKEMHAAGSLTQAFLDDVITQAQLLNKTSLLPSLKNFASTCNHLT
ncbi:integrator complex subunit 6 [Pelomyxa schiedti]|nr:integrator complex subunit 6 [Pelomyxa schiedti]